MQSTSIRAWVIGCPEHPEFRELAAWLAAHGDVRWSDEREAGVEQKAGVETADLIVFLQARPGQFRDEDVARCVALAPLARLVVVWGSMCDGEPRTGRPLAGVLRVAWHDWRPHFERNWAAWRASEPAPSSGRFGERESDRRETAGDRTSVWWLPRTASLAERIVHDSRDWGPGPQRLCIGIEARETAGFEALAAACRAAGHAAARMRSDAPDAVVGVDVGIWDEPGWSRDDLDELVDFVQRCRGAPVVAVLGFPRVGDVEAAYRAGAAAVLGKPFLLNDLLWEVGRIGCGPRPRRVDNRV